MKKMNFKPVFLYKDEVQIKQISKRLEKGAKLLNDFVALVEQNLSMAFDDKEKMIIKKEGMNFVVEKMRSKFPFPNATDDFNLQAIGLDKKPLENFHNKNSRFWKPFKYELKKGIFMVSKDLIEEEEKKYYFYTKNSNQNVALEMAEGLKEQLKKADNAGFIRKFSKGSIYELTDLIDYSLNNSKHPEWQINYHYIRTLL